METVTRSSKTSVLFRQPYETVLARLHLKGRQDSLIEGWFHQKKLNPVFNCLTDKALEYANRAEGQYFSSLKNELALRYDLQDKPVAARQQLHVIRQKEEESLEDSCIDSYSDGDAHNATLQHLTTEVFLHGYKFKDAATLDMNESPKSVQEACRRVKTIRRRWGPPRCSFRNVLLRSRRKNRWL